jgi:hypothetical protein
VYPDTIVHTLYEYSRVRFSNPGFENLSVCARECQGEAEQVHASLMADKIPGNAGSPGCIDLTVQGSNSEESESDSEVAVKLDGEDEQGKGSSNMCDRKRAREDKDCAVQAGAVKMPKGSGSAGRTAAVPFSPEAGENSPFSPEAGEKGQ